MSSSGAKGLISPRIQPTETDTKQERLWVPTYSQSVRLFFPIPWQFNTFNSGRLPNQSLFSLFCGCVFNTVPLRSIDKKARDFKGKAQKEQNIGLPIHKSTPKQNYPSYLFQPCPIFWHSPLTSLLAPFHPTHLAHNPCTLIICPPSTHFSFVSHLWKPITSSKS